MEYKGWTWLYAVYGVNLVDSAIDLFGAGWRPEDRDVMQKEYDMTDDEVASYIDVFERMLKDREEEEE